MILRFVFLGLLAPLYISDLAIAETLHVPADYPTIQSCIDAAVSGQDECVVAPGTYNELINFLGKAITLRSSDGPYVTTIDGSGLGGSVVTFSSNQTTEATMEGFTIAGGVGTKLNGFTRGGGIHIRGEIADYRLLHFELRNVVVAHNDADYGGGIYVSGEDVLTLSECEVTANTARYGGGIFGSSYSKIEVMGVYFGDNSAQYDGGALWGHYVTLDSTRAKFAQNTAGRTGGAIAIQYNLDSAEVDSTIDDSWSTSAIRNPNYVSVSDCVFESNEALGSGGAISVAVGSLDVSRSSFRNNTATLGGAIVDASRAGQISQCVFLQNQSVQDGGAVVNYGAIYSSSFQDNHAGKDGGAIFGQQYQGGSVVNCSFARNSARRGGAVLGYMDAKGATFAYNHASDSGGAWYGSGAAGGVFLGNSADQAGGAMYVNGPARILDSLFVGNLSPVGGALYNAGGTSIYNATFVANDGGGAISNVGGPMPASSLAITSSILWHNWAPPLWIDEKAYNTSITASNIEGSGGSSNWDPSFGIDDGGNMDLEPMLVRLPDDVGPGAFGDLRLQPGSPCINSGDPDFVPPPGETDLDGHARLLCGRVDMGAYEFGIGDYDCDQVVDLVDLVAWESCATDPTASPSPRPSPLKGEGVVDPPLSLLIKGGGQGCEAFDFDADGDVDLRDLAQFMHIIVP